MDLRKNYGSKPKKQKKTIIKEDIFKCDSCHYTIVVKTELKRHMFLIHQKKPHPTAMKKVSVKSDSKSKEKEPPVECLRCWYSCKAEEELVTHTEKIHEKEESEQKKLEGELIYFNSNRNQMV